MRVKGFILVAIIMTALSLSGCGGGGSSTNHEPTITSYTPDDLTLSASFGDSLDFSVTASDADSDPLSYSWTASGGDILGSANSCTWTAPSIAADYTLTAKVSDGNSITTTSWTIRVAGEPNQAPTLASATPSGVITVITGDSLEFSIAGDDANNDPLTYSWSAAAGTLSATSGQTVTWTAPQLTEAIEISFTISDGIDEYTGCFTAYVEPVEIAGGDLTVPTVWNGNRVYKVSNAVSIKDSGSLTIEPGAIIKFDYFGGIGCMVAGTYLEAVGTPEKPIIFTSVNDDAHGGDTNQDGAASSPTRGSWYKIYENPNYGNTGRINLQFCTILYGAKEPYYNNTAVSVERTDSIVANCTFINNEKGLEAGQSIPISNLRNNVFYGNRIPMLMSSGVNLDDSNTFHNPQNPIQKNDYNGVWVLWTPATQDDVIWQETEVPFVVDSSIDYISGEINTLSIANTGSLTLGDGVAMKFGPGCTLQHNDNILNYNGSGVYFTALTDDTVLGDTNNDANTTSPELNYWAGVLGPLGYNLWGSIYYDSNAGNTH